MSQPNLNISWSVLLRFDKLKVDIHWTLDKGGLAAVGVVVHWDTQGDAACNKKQLYL